MDSVDLETLLDLPLLRGLAPDELRRLSEHWSQEARPRGEYVFRRGEAGDALYVILEGQVAIENAVEGLPPLLALFGPGEWFGELAVLTGQPRSADARVALDATLLRIDRDGWAALSMQAPRVFARLCERLSRELVATNTPRSRARRSVILCEEGDAWVSELEQSLLRQFPARPVRAIAGASRAAAARALAAIAAPDALVLVAGGAGLADLADRRLRREDARRWRLSPGRGGCHTEELSGRDPQAALDRVARRLAGGAVGLALGAGGAYGLSHIGLLRVLEDAGIPVDFVAGTSMGAIVGGAYSAGVPLPRLEELAARVARGYASLVLRDLDLRGPALLRGHGAMRLLSELEELAGATFESLTIPFVAVAMDLGTGQAVRLGEGAVLEAIRPSFAIPGIFPTCRVGERSLVDGAMASPVPVEHARALGADFVIAAQPIPSLTPEGVGYRSAVARAARRVVDLLPIWRLQHALSTLDSSIRSFQALWHRLASAASADADAVVQPDLGSFSFLQFGAAPEIIAEGRRCAEDALPQLRARLAERVGLAVLPPAR